MTRGRSSRALVLLTAGILCAGLAACAGSEPAGEATAALSPSATPESEPTEVPAQKADSGDTAIRILFGDKVLAAVLWDNPAAYSLVEQLPVTLDFSPYGDQEVTATAPQPITMDGMPEGDAPVAGDIGYYAPDRVVTFHFAEIGYWTGSARLGRIDGNLSLLQGQGGPFSVTIERAG